jgi:tetratricopeptide (TPR) repeat protein
MIEKEIIIEIDRYIRGELSPIEIDRLWELFLKEPEYFDWFETELHLKKLAIDSKKGNIHPLHQKDGKTSPIRGLYTKWVAGVAAALIIGFGLQFYFMDSSFQIHPYAAESIDYTELAGADLFRSDEDRPALAELAMNQGIAFAYNGEEERAISRFKEVLEMDTDSATRTRVLMNLGILYYNTRDYEAAVRQFHSVTGLDELPYFFEEKAWWFLGNAYLNLRELSEAKNALLNTVELDGRYKESAAILIEKLDSESTTER